MLKSIIIIIINANSLAMGANKILQISKTIMLINVQILSLNSW